mmetsp:Transcript_9923/g.14730  ORF Transcript_9923/g.14730 Transcript_9923/m.14730 type:complete len:563 (+) Transcript_9923:495-2183(+)
MKGRDYSENGSNTTIQDESGLIPRALYDLFRSFENEANFFDVSFSLSYLQIYCEILHDLLKENTEKSQESLSVREPEEGQLFVENLNKISVTSLAEALHCLHQGEKRRIKSSTSLNAHSSRSHAVVIFTVTKRPRTCGKATVSHLLMADLAGSERAKSAQVQYQQFEELKAINLSLSALGNCVSALASKKQHVPFRDSKLTRILQPSFSGNCRTAVIVCVKPGADDEGQTLRSLQFAQRASKIGVVAQVNQVVDYKNLYKELQTKKDKKEENNMVMEIEIDRLKSQANLSEEKVAELKEHISLLEEQLSGQKKTFHTQLNSMNSEKCSTSEKMIQCINEKWKIDIEETKQKYLRDLDRVKDKYEQRNSLQLSSLQTLMKKYKELEDELQKERENHLNALKNARLISETLKRQEVEHANRVAEFLTEIEGKNDEIRHLNDKHNEQEKRSDTKINEMMRQLNQVGKVSDKKSSYQSSQKALYELETLFTETVEKLSERVNLLEGPSKTGVRMTDSLRVEAEIQTNRSKMNHESRKILENIERRSSKPCKNVQVSGTKRLGGKRW